MRNDETSTLKQDALNYYAFLVEDRMGLSADITKYKNSLEIQLYEESSITSEHAHMFCINLMISVMESYNVFIPFKLYDHEGALVTLETYAQFDAVDVIPSDTTFFLDDEDDEEFHNFG